MYPSTLLFAPVESNMVYLPKPKQRRTFGFSLEPELADRIDAFEPKRGRRSQFIADTIELGLERRFGPNWRDMADQLRAAQASETTVAS